MGWAGHVAGTGDNKNHYNILARAPEGKGILEKSRRRGEGKTKIHPEGSGRNDVWSGFIRLNEGITGRLM